MVLEEEFSHIEKGIKEAFNEISESLSNLKEKVGKEVDGKITKEQKRLLDSLDSLLKDIQDTPEKITSFLKTLLQGLYLYGRIADMISNFIERLDDMIDLWIRFEDSIDLAISFGKIPKGRK